MSNTNLQYKHKRMITWVWGNLHELSKGQDQRLIFNDENTEDIFIHVIIQEFHGNHFLDNSCQLQKKINAKPVNFEKSLFLCKNQ